MFLGGIFVLAPLFFALAVQATAWFLAGSLPGAHHAPALRRPWHGAVLLHLLFLCGHLQHREPARHVPLGGVRPGAQRTGQHYAARRTQAFAPPQDQINAMVSDLARAVQPAGAGERPPRRLREGAGGSKRRVFRRPARPQPFQLCELRGLCCGLQRLPCQRHREFLRRAGLGPAGHPGPATASTARAPWPRPRRRTPRTSPPSRRPPRNLAARARRWRRSWKAPAPFCWTPSPPPRRRAPSPPTPAPPWAGWCSWRRPRRAAPSPPTTCCARWTRPSPAPARG